MAPTSNGKPILAAEATLNQIYQNNYFDVTVVIRLLRRELKFPAIIELGFFSNISHQMMI